MDQQGLMPKPIHVLNGPNLNLLGLREPHLYGTTTLDQVRALAEARAEALGYGLVFRQSNHEGVLIDWIQEARTEASALVINPAGYGHTSIALLDALKTLTIPVVECHLTNPAAREVTVAAAQTVYAPAPQMAAPAPVAAPAAAPVAPAAEVPPAPVARTGDLVKSPMVGTVYLQPQPGAEPFAKVGDMVAQGQTLMIIEAMKTMNPVPAPRAGKVVELLVGDSQPVEFGEPLIVLE